MDQRKLALALEKAVPLPRKIEIRGKDIFVKTKDRTAAANAVHAYLNSKKIQYQSLMRTSKSTSFPVTWLPSEKIDVVYIVYKPIIVKGEGGLLFEREVAQDLREIFGGEILLEDARHPDVMKAINKRVRLRANALASVDHNGSENAKRPLSLSGNSLKIANVPAKSLADVSIKDEKGESHISLKLGKSYYTLGSAIAKLILQDPVKVYKFFGLDGSKMAEFGKEFSADYTPPKSLGVVKRNIETLVSESFGSGVMLVHKVTGGSVVVTDLKEKGAPVVSIDKLDSSCYRYPSQGIRQYAAITTSAVISGARYRIEIQFRGAKPSDVGPKYMRIHLTKL